MDLSLKSRQEEYALLATSLPTYSAATNNSELVKVNEELIKVISEANMTKSDCEDVVSMKESINKMEQVRLIYIDSATPPVHNQQSIHAKNN